MALIEKAGGSSIYFGTSNDWDFTSYDTSSATELSWLTTNNRRITVTGTFVSDGGSGFTGTVDSIEFRRVESSTDPDLEMGTFASPLDLADLQSTLNVFWATVLAGADTFNIAGIQSTILAGDAYQLSGVSGFAAQSDTINMSGRFVTISGDADAVNGTTVGADDAFTFLDYAPNVSYKSNLFAYGDFRAVSSGSSTGGNDTFTDLATRDGGTVTIAGDYNRVESIATAFGGDDQMTGSAANVFTVYGDFNVLSGTGTGGDDEINGNSQDDVLIGDANDVTGTLTAGGDYIAGGGGNDTIIGDGSNITGVLIGGNDTLKGGSGNDTIYGEYMTDNGGDLGTTGNDEIDGEAGDDTIYGQLGDDELRGGTGTDQLFGGAGNDQLFAEEDEDATGTETYDGGTGTDTLVGTEYFDMTMDAATPLFVSHDMRGANIVSIERISFVPLSDEGTHEFIFDGNDFISTNGAFSSTTSVTGTDIAGRKEQLKIYLDANSTNLSLEKLLFTDWGGQGELVRILATTDDDLDVTGSSVDDFIVGKGGADTLSGFSGDDVLKGGANADTMLGGAGDDTYFADASDTLVELAGEGTDTVKSGATHALAQNFENLVLTGNKAINGTGNGAANELTGNSRNNVLDGKQGDDTMRGKGGADTYVVGSAGDTVVEAKNKGKDTVLSKITYNLGANLENLDLTGNKKIDATGNALKNKLIGNNKANKLKGLKGADVLKGEGGKDKFVFKSKKDSGTTKATRDKILDFDDKGNDKIDLSGFKGTLTYLGTAELTGKNQVHVEKKGKHVLVEVSTDKDAAAEFSILLTHTKIADMGADDFLL